MSVLCAFASALLQPTWSTVQVLLIGTLLARGQRTVTATLRQMGLNEASHAGLYHHVLKRVCDYWRRCSWMPPCMCLLRYVGRAPAAVRG
jgi:hypothetical protein